jgi:hypothetical protein
VNLPPEVEQQILTTPGVRVTSAKPAAFHEVPVPSFTPKQVRGAPKMVAPSWAIEVVVPLILPNLLNLGGGPLRKKIALPKEQRTAVMDALSLVAPSVPVWLLIGRGWTVTLVRLGGRRLDRSAIPAALKHVEDAVAMWLFPGSKPGVMDDDERIIWVREQKPKGPVGLRIRIESLE